MLHIEILILLLKFCAVYFVFSNSFYFVLLLFSYFGLKERQQRVEEMKKHLQKLRDENSEPRMSIIIPAFNEENVVLESLSSYLTMDYSNYEIILVDDGSTDGTFEAVKNAFELQPANFEKQRSFSRAEILGQFRSLKAQNLKVIRQENRGKSGALNTGFDFATGEFCCTADADTIPEASAISNLIMGFFDKEKEVVAVGGTVRIANGSVYQNHHIVKGRLPQSYLLIFQVIEYIRSFFCGRSGWEWAGSTILLSGALATFRSTALEKIGGFDENSITEDLEVILRLRWQSRLHHENWAIRLIPDPLCWTQAPSTLSALRRQRIRWQQGLAQTMWKYFSLILNPSYGTAGLFHLPYVLVFEWIGPWVELIGYITVLLSLYFRIVPFETVMVILVFGIFLSVAVSLLSIFFEESRFAKESSWQSRMKFFGAAFLENFGYHQILWVWRLEGMIRLLFQKPKWGKQHRHSNTKESHFEDDNPNNGSVA